tara:strand:- start:13141 stop:13311 length:171 start_codon:yes stop_codon:yes gene_type:complete
MEEKEISEEQRAYLYIAQLLDIATQKGAFSRQEVVGYNNALIMLDNLFVTEVKDGE